MSTTSDHVRVKKNIVTRKMGGSKGKREVGEEKKEPKPDTGSRGIGANNSCQTADPNIRKKKGGSLGQKRNKKKSLFGGIRAWEKDQRLGGGGIEEKGENSGHPN